MAFPTDLDDLTDMTATNTLGAEGHNARHTELNTAAEALEAKVGADSSAVTSSHDYKITTNTAGIATNVTDIATNASDISTLDSGQTTNTNNIATNTADIATNVTDIATNVTNISNITGYQADGWIAAGETWTYASDSDPVYTFTVPTDLTTKYWPGMKLKMTNDGSAQYFMVTKVAYSSPNTTITVYGGTDYDLANSAITLPFYSPWKAPYGFPLDPIKWTQILIDTSSRTQATPTVNTWYNLGTLSLVIPVGSWHVRYQVTLDVSDASASFASISTTLSTANNSESDNSWSTYQGISTSTNETKYSRSTTSRHGVITIATTDTYYLNARTVNTGITEIEFMGNIAETIVSATCAYL